MSFLKRNKPAEATAAAPATKPGIEPATEWLDKPDGATDEELRDGRTMPLYSPNPAHKCGGYMRNANGVVVLCWCRFGGDNNTSYAKQAAADSA